VKHLTLVLVLLGAIPGAAAAQLHPPPPEKTTAAKPAEVDSLPLLEKAVAKDSSKVDNLYKLGVMYMDRDRPADAVKVLTKAYGKRPKDLRLLVNHDALGHGKDAQDFYGKALEIAPGDSVATCRLASSLYADGKHQQSIDLLRGLLQHSPNSYCAYFQLGVAFADAGIYRDAIRMWQKVVELAPTSPEAVSAQESITVLQKFVQ
jgi:cytochrome c-type biogenesis protein CcmH/NrfG